MAIDSDTLKKLKNMKESLADGPKDQAAPAGAAKGGNAAVPYTSQKQLRTAYNQVQANPVPQPKAQTVNYDVVDEAEKAIQALNKNNRGQIKLTKSQIRKFLTAVNVVRNKVDRFKAENKAADKLPTKLAAEVKFLKVTVAYQSGREWEVKDFAEKAGLSGKIADIGQDMAKFYKFCRYVEALVAYHKYYGGRD